MVVSRGTQRIGEVLVAAGLVDSTQLKSGLAHLEQWGGRLTHALCEMGLADEETMATAIGRAYSLDVVPLGTVPKDPGALKVLQASFCKEHGFYPLSLKDRLLTLAVSDPSDLGGIDQVKALAAPARVRLVLATEAEVQHAIERHYFGRVPRILSNKARKAVTRDLPLQPEPGALEVDTSAPPPLSGAGYERGETFDFSDEEGEGWTPELRARLARAQENQQKTTLMFKVVRELLFEKGVLDE